MSLTCVRERAALAPTRHAGLACERRSLSESFFLKAAAFMVLLHSSCQAAAEGPEWTSWTGGGRGREGGELWGWWEEAGSQ